MRYLSEMAFPARSYSRKQLFCGRVIQAAESLRVLLELSSLSEATRWACESALFGSVPAAQSSIILEDTLVLLL